MRLKDQGTEDGNNDSEVVGSHPASTTPTTGITSTAVPSPAVSATTTTASIGSIDSMSDQRDEARDLILSVLKSSSTKRESKSYLTHFVPAPTKPTVAAPHVTSHLCDSSSPTVMHNSEPTQAVAGVPHSVFGDHKSRTKTWIQRILSRQQSVLPTDFNYTPSSTTADFFAPEIKEEQIHIALVKIRQVQDVSDETLGGIGKTLVRLRKLGLIPVVVIDPVSTEGAQEKLTPLEWRTEMRMQSSRVVQTIEQAKGHARTIDGACVVKVECKNPTPANEGEELKGEGNGEEVSITLPQLIVAALSHGTIPIIPPIAIDTRVKAVEINADSIILALTRLFSQSGAAPLPPHKGALPEPSLTSVDRIIYIDPLGGIPSTDRPNNSAHVFLNMEQEYEAVKEELIVGPVGDRGLPVEERVVHLRTLKTLRQVLAILPSSSSAMITTPEAAATSTHNSNLPNSSLSATNTSNDTLHPSSPNPTAVTNTQPTPPSKIPIDRNPLIHNLLTDKPVFSSSLPILSPSSPYKTPTTLLKHGIPLVILTNLAYPYPGHKVFKLNDGTIDLDRLVYLIEDSFGKKLDVERYLQRVNDRIAGLIIAGDYEGAAIVTWETDGRATGKYGARGPEAWKKVLYLDKFVVLRRCQGTGGVADVVFKAMVMGVFPGEGILWRSRKMNVVNKWYFERAKGTYMIPDSKWTMFWTGGQGKEVDGGRGKFEQYLGICSTLESIFG